MVFCSMSSDLLYMERGELCKAFPHLKECAIKVSGHHPASMARLVMVGRLGKVTYRNQKKTIVKKQYTGSVLSVGFGDLRSLEA